MYAKVRHCLYANLITPLLLQCLSRSVDLGRNWKGANEQRKWSYRIHDTGVRCFFSLAEKKRKGEAIATCKPMQVCQKGSRGLRFSSL